LNRILRVYASVFML